MAGSADTEPSQHFEQLPIFRSALACKDITTNNSESDNPESTNPKGMEAYCELCGWALALVHAKSGDAAMIAGYLGKSDEIDDELTKFAFAYSEQNESDYDVLKKAAREHRIKVASTRP